MSDREMEDVTGEYSPIELLALKVLQAHGHAYRRWIPRWVDEMYGREAKTIAAFFADEFDVRKYDESIEAKASDGAAEQGL